MMKANKLNSYASIDPLSNTIQSAFPSNRKIINPILFNKGNIAHSNPRNGINSSHLNKIIQSLNKSNQKLSENINSMEDTSLEKIQILPRIATVESDKRKVDHVSKNVNNTNLRPNILSNEKNMFTSEEIAESINRISKLSSNEEDRVLKSFVHQNKFNIEGQKSNNNTSQDELLLDDLVCNSSRVNQLFENNNRTDLNVNIAQIESNLMDMQYSISYFPSNYNYTNNFDFDESSNSLDTELVGSDISSSKKNVNNEYNTENYNNYHSAYETSKENLSFSVINNSKDPSQPKTDCDMSIIVGNDIYLLEPCDFCVGRESVELYLDLLVSKRHCDNVNTQSLQTDALGCVLLARQGGGQQNDKKNESYDDNTKKTKSNNSKRDRNKKENIEQLNRHGIPTAGYPNVSFDITHNRWIAFWRLAGRNHSKSFSCNKYGGRETARQRAVEFRRRVDKEIFEKNTSPIKIISLKSPENESHDITTDNANELPQVDDIEQEKQHFENVPQDNKSHDELLCPEIMGKRTRRKFKRSQVHTSSEIGAITKRRPRTTFSRRKTENNFANVDKNGKPVQPSDPNANNFKTRLRVVSGSITFDRSQNRFMAQWKTADGTKHSKSFYIKTYGNFLEAQRQASAFRMQLLAERDKDKTLAQKPRRVGRWTKVSPAWVPEEYCNQETTWDPKVSTENDPTIQPQVENTYNDTRESSTVSNY